jgi:fibro-slime domain-containing protein
MNRKLISFLPLLAWAVACSSDAQKRAGENQTGGPSGQGGSSINVGDGGETATALCAAIGALRDQCMLVPSGPACGDGKLNQMSEACDDGNSLPGDGCSGICKVEPYFECPTPGQPCVSTIKCGDGVIGPGEACDDGNKSGGDGCSATCNLVEKGFVCRTAGMPCTRVHLCGDGVVDSNEGCDDGNNTAGDGCDPKCRTEIGFKCSGSPSACTKTTCGDGIVEGAESCDDKNTTPFDGCSANCQAEPACNGGPCTTKCGDGIVFGGEECDDGNLRDGDGCSKNCTVESGYKCDNNAGACVKVNGKCTMPIPAAFRDTDQKVNPDFQPGYDNQGVIAGLVSPTLDAEGKPVWSGNTNGYIHSATTFGQWYRNTPGVNALLNGKIVLWDNGAGGFVNRWKDATGEQWVSYGANPINWCDNSSCAAPGCAVTAPRVCLQPCTPWGNNNSACTATPTAYDGNPLFFPVDGFNDGLPLTSQSATVGPPYTGNGYMGEPGGQPHNFHFTTEVHYWFTFKASANARLDFLGDDDVWVFVNRKLALDLGGWHSPIGGGFTLDAAAGSTYGLTDGQVYEIAVFHAERRTDGSSFKLTLTGFNLAPSDCVTDCGDGKITAGEECDDGVAKNKGGYNECRPDCTLGPRCGDGVKQDQYQEACDDGKNDGSYGGCAPDCKPGPHCGDGIVQADHEQCDDGANDGGYGRCAPGCVLGPHCGDGVLQPGQEECDDGNNKDADGCSAACKNEIAVAK